MNLELALFSAILVAAYILKWVWENLPVRGEVDDGVTVSSLSSLTSVNSPCIGQQCGGEVDRSSATKGELKPSWAAGHPRTSTALG